VPDPLNNLSSVTTCCQRAGVHGSMARGWWKLVSKPYELEILLRSIKKTDTTLHGVP
jgi:hypothetical protein